jgi:hypothetical protein
MTMSLAAQTAGLVTRANKTDPLPNIGTEINQAVNRIKCVWDFAVLGGAISSINMLDDQGNTATLPKGAVVTSALAYVVTAPVGASGTIGFSLLGTSDLMAQTAITSLTIGVLWQAVPVLPGAAASFTTLVGPVTAAGGSIVKVKIATTAQTAGKIILFLDYLDIN